MTNSIWKSSCVSQTTRNISKPVWLTANSHSCFSSQWHGWHQWSASCQVSAWPCGSSSHSCFALICHWHRLLVLNMKKWKQYLSGHRVLWLIHKPNWKRTVKGYKGFNRRNRTQYFFFDQRMLLNQSSTDESIQHSLLVFCAWYPTMHSWYAVDLLRIWLTWQKKLYRRAPGKDNQW